MPEFTLCTTVYRQPLMLARQLTEWEQYPPGINIVCVDDGSPEPARDVLAAVSEQLKPRLRLYRVTKDIQWHRAGARNLAATKAETDFIVMVDLDHILPASAAARLLEYQPSPDFWHRFRRYRIGKADETRMKDLIPRDAEYGEIKPHIDGYMITKKMYWDVGGYDEDFAGCLGGGTEFLGRLTRKFGDPLLLPADVYLHVYTRDKIKDASVWSLSRDRNEGKRRQRLKAGHWGKPERPLRFEWSREL